LCVTDTNIWIDLYRGGLAENAFKQPLELVAPDVIIEELKEPDGDLLISSGLRVQELSGSQVLTVLDFAERYARPSREDLFALVLARDFNAVLLTGDASLGMLQRTKA
jgi:predicted nucleic acid-binding protein